MSRNSPKIPTIAITGAGGFLGSQLVKHFAAKDWKVIGLVRQPQKVSAEGASFRKFDLAAPVAPGLLKDVDYLVHAAYIKYDKANPDALASNLAGAERLLAESKKQHVTKNVFISSMSAHDEAISIYGKQKLAVEQLFSGAHDAVIRSGLILGNGGIVQQMASFMRSKHMVPLIGGGRQPLQTIAVYDLARAIDAVITQDAAGRFTLASVEVYTYKQFYQALSKAIAVKVLFVPVPFGLLLGMFRLASLLHLPLGVGEDNLLGLKMLRSAATKNDLQRLGLRLDNMETALSRSHIK